MLGGGWFFLEIGIESPGELTDLVFTLAWFWRMPPAGVFDLELGELVEYRQQAERINRERIEAGNG